MQSRRLADLFCRGICNELEAKSYVRTSLRDEAGGIVAEAGLGVGEGEGEVTAGEAVPGMHCQ